MSVHTRTDAGGGHTNNWGRTRSTVLDAGCPSVETND